MRSNYYKARQYFLENDERCRVWEEKGIKWVMHHKDPSWKTNDPERYEQWNIDDLLPMTRWAHMVVHHTGVPMSEEARVHNSEAHRGNKNPYYGIGFFTGHHHTEEWKKQMSERLKGEKNPRYGKHHSHEAKRLLSESHTGRHFYNNGVIEVLEYECPEGFVLGRLPGRGGSNKGRISCNKGVPNIARRGTHWYNNGIINVLSKECPEGFIPGKLKKERKEI